jgi:hypothetical protein
MSQVEQRLRDIRYHDRESVVNELDEEEKKSIQMH